MGKRQGASTRYKKIEPSERDYQDLCSALAEADALLPVLARLLPEPSSGGPATGTIGRHAPESSEPWQTEAADAYWRIWFGARKLANRLAKTLGLGERSYPAGATGRALTMIGSYAVKLDPEALADTLARVSGWVVAARRIRDIDEVDSWQPLPRPKGFPPPACPYCHTMSLRMAKGREEVKCFFPECTDIDGNPTRARMEIGRFSAGGHLVFGDGTVVAYREEHEPAQ